jgi:Mitochondrial domain of unknown function (DUF1713)
VTGRLTGVPVSAGALSPAARRPGRAPGAHRSSRGAGHTVGSVIKKRRKRMAKKKHRKLLKKTRVQRRNKK